MTNFALNLSRPIKEMYDVNEYEGLRGVRWLEIFPYVFVKIGDDAKPVWERFYIRNPNVDGLRLAVTGDISIYQAHRSHLMSAIRHLCRTVDWLRDVDFVENGEFNIAKVLAHLSVANSHDSLGARWIDRLRWIDAIAGYITEENSDSFRHADPIRNTQLFRELNWLSVVVTASATGIYRRITNLDYENWELNSPALEMASACDVSDEYHDDFVANRCDNSMIRDLVVAHLLFEDAIDPNPNYIANNSYSQLKISRAESRKALYEKLGLAVRPDFWAIRTMLLPPEIAINLREIFNVLCSYPIEVAEELLRTIVDVFRDPDTDDSDVYSDTYEYLEMISMFVSQHPNWFPDFDVNLSWWSTESFDLAKRRADWVYDEVAFFDYAPTLDLTRYQLVGSQNSADRKAATGSVPAAALVLAVLGFALKTGADGALHDTSKSGRSAFPTRFDDGPLGGHIKSYYEIYSKGIRNAGV